MARLRAAEQALRVVAIISLTQASPGRATLTWRDTPDYNIPQGTCYYSAGKQSNSAFVPCGNTAFGTFSCCELSSVCLGNNACYSAQDGTTYVAGCTDPTYSDSSCPNRGPYSAQQWSGLVYCNGTSNEWTLCDDSSANSQTVTFVPGCYCPQDESSRNIAFDAPSVLANHVSLPATQGGTMSFFAGYTPNTVPTSTAAASSTTTPTSASSSSTTASDTSDSSASAAASSSSSSSISTPGLIISAAATSSSSGSMSSSSAAPAQLSHGLSTGAKAGIGVGTVLAVCAVLGLIGCIFFYRRRRIQRSSVVAAPGYQSAPEAGPPEKQPFGGTGATTSAWPANRSELQGDERHSTSLYSPDSVQQPWSRPVSTEFDGSTPTYQSMGSIASHQYADHGSSHPAFRRAETPLVGVQRIPHSSTGSQASYRPGRQVGNDYYEMPAEVPGSTLP